MSPAATTLLLLAAAAVLAGCQSTQEKSAAIDEEGGKSFAAKGLSVKKLSKDVKVVSTAVLSDENGVATVAQLKNKSKKVLVKVPVAINVLGTGKKSVYRNNLPETSPSLTHVSLLKPGETIFWANDAVVPAGEPRKVKFRPGVDAGDPPEKLPEIDVGPAKLVVDPVSGVAAEGKVTNKSDLLQRKLVVYGAARKGQKIVAAGRSLVEKLKPGKTATYQIFFIGNPRGATLELAAPPTALE